MPKFRYMAVDAAGGELADSLAHLANLLERESRLAAVAAAWPPGWRRWLRAGAGQ